MFDQETRTSVEKQLSKYEDSTSTQIVILTVEDIGENTTIEEYSYKIASAWKIGQKDKDNGLLITVAKKQKKVRLETGYGLEGTLPDATCWYIIEHCFLENVKGKRPDFDTAIKETIDAVILSIGGEFQAVKNKVEKEGQAIWFLITLGVIALIAGFVGIGYDSSIASGVVGTIVYPIAWLYFWNADPLVLIGMAVIGFIVCFVARYIIEAAGEGGSGSGGYSFGGGSSGFSDGGFSGGGGSFGGGGCSGGW